MEEKLNIAIVDFGLGNLYSVKHACSQAGMDGKITSNIRDLEACDAIFLPGVGAFQDAMHNLSDAGLIDPLRSLSSEKPLIGICLGLQLLMSSSEEFGTCRGLDIIPGKAAFLGRPKENGRELKVPHVGWNSIRCPLNRTWDDSPLAGIEEGVSMYFVHSYYVVPEEEEHILCDTCYGDVRFCSGVIQGNVAAFQFHPEKSGPQGIRIYENIAEFIRKRTGKW